MIQIGKHRIDIKQARLFIEDSNSPIPIEPKLCELLSLFISKPNCIFSRQELLAHLWPNTIVTDNAINKLIANLRKLLRDNAKQPEYVETIPKRGYRLICKVEQAPTNAPATDLGHASINKKSILKTAVKIVAHMTLL